MNDEGAFQKACKSRGVTCFGMADSDYDDEVEIVSFCTDCAKMFSSRAKVVVHWSQRHGYTERARETF